VSHVEGGSRPDQAVELAPGALLIARPSQDADAVFARTVILIVDREPNGITTGVALNRTLDKRVTDSSALALLFVPDPSATVFWGGPMGSDPAILAQFSATDGLEWFHLPKEQQRPFPLPDVGMIAVAEHPDPFEGRTLRARLFVGLCVWGRGQLEAELARAEWMLARATPDDIFAAQPAGLWETLLSRCSG
jgi:putative transcriptional regulator